MDQGAKPGLGSSAVAVIGDNTIDEYLAPSRRVLVGGNALNVAVQLSVHGTRAEYFGAIGDDHFGEEIRGALVSNSVGTRGLVLLPGRTAVTRIDLTPTNDRVFVSEDFGVTADYSPAERDLDVAATAGWVHIGMLPQASAVKSALRRRNPEIRISQDLAVTAGAEALDVAFISAGEDGDPRHLAQTTLAQGAGLAVVTRGPLGAFASDGIREWSQDALPTSVVDTTGAGDSFIAGFIGARIAGSTVKDALRAGAALASATCTHTGGFPQSEEKEEK